MHQEWITSTYLKDFFMVLLLDVEVQQFLFEIVTLATILYTLLGVVNLEKE